MPSGQLFYSRRNLAVASVIEALGHFTNLTVEAWLAFRNLEVIVAKSGEIQ